MGPPAIERKQIGRYENLSLLGQGGMGAVYRAHDPSLERTVALKVVLDQNEQFLARFQREAKAVARLSHPNIVQVYDFGQDEDGNPFFVMELVKGKALDAVVKASGPLPADKVVELLRQAAQGLAAAHAAGIVHRDIKPQNMLLDEGGIIKLVDFGIARVTGVNEGITHTNEALGTLHYMAPEVLSGQPADLRADIYSLGLVGFHLLTGKAPFSGPSAVAVAMKQISEPLPDLSKEAPLCPSSLRRLIERMTVKERERRIQTCDEIARECAAITDELSKTEPMTTRLPAASRRVVLYAAGLGLSSAVVLALILGSLGLKRRRANPEKTAPKVVAADVAPKAAASVPAPTAAPPLPEPKPKLAGPVRVAILSFRNLSTMPGHENPGEGIAESITTAFDGLQGKIRLLERNQLEDKVLKTAKESLADFTDKNEVVQYGKMIGAEIIVQGAFQRLDNTLRITARFTKVETSEIIDSLVLTERYRSAEDAFLIHDKVANELREHLVKLLPQFRDAK